MTLTGFGRLARLVLRRDRLRLPLWIAGIAGTVVASAASLPPVYPDQAAIDDYVRFFGDNPALIAFAGPGYGFDDPSIGVILVNETQVFAMIGTALMSIFLVNRHTRAEEESERAELIRSSVVGRHAPAAAAVAVVAAAQVVVGLLCAAGFVLLDYPATGSFALAGSMAAVGLVFAGVTAVAAQVSSSGRVTLGLGSAALAVAFSLRAVGDIGENWLRWTSPMGWAQAVRAYADERWWTLGLCLAFSVALVAGAFWLSTKRDLGAGLVAQRPGRARAAGWVTSPLGLAFRLQRGALVGWCVGLFAFGVVYGSIAEDVDELIEDNPDFADFIAQLEGASLTDSYLATAMTMLAVIASGWSISSTLRLRSEEAAGRAEPLLAGAVSRWRWAASHLAIAALGTVAVMAAAGLGTGIAHAVVSEDAGNVGRMLGAALVTVPAVLVATGLAIALFGFAPGLAPAAWAALAVMAVVGFLGDVLRLPRWTRALSPLDHVPGIPAQDLRVVPLVVLAAIAAGLAGAGLWGFRQRDLRAA